MQMKKALPVFAPLPFAVSQMEWADKIAQGCGAHGDRERERHKRRNQCVSGLEVASLVRLKSCVKARYSPQLSVKFDGGAVRL